MDPTLSSIWISAIVVGVIIGTLYLICCIYSLKKAIRDRKGIIERNQEKRNNKYLKEMGLDSQNVYSDSSQNFKYLNNGKTGAENDKGEWSHYSNYPLTNARKVNLEDIDEIINEALSNAESTTSSIVDRTVSETSQSHGKEIKADKDVHEPLMSEKSKKIISADTGPRVYYLKARTPERREQEPVMNWVTERLNNASSFASAQRQLQYGFKKAPLAKQNSGFSSLDEDSSAS